MAINYVDRLVKSVSRNKLRVATQSKQRRGGVTDLYALDYVSEIRNGVLNSTKSDLGGTAGSGVNLEKVEEDDSTVEGRVRTLTRAIKAKIPDAVPNGIAGIVGCFGMESDVTAKRYEADYATNYQYDKMRNEPTVENLMGSWGAFLALYNGLGLNQQGYQSNGKHWLGVGLGQWTGPRGENLFRYAKENNGDIFSFSTQVAFMLTEPRLSDVFRQVATSNASVEETTADFLARWEGVPGNKLAERIAYGKKFLPLIEESLKGTDKPLDDTTHQVPEATAVWKRVYTRTDEGDANLKDHARRARHLIMELFNVTEAGGYRADDDGFGTGHSSGLAIDFMVGDDSEKGTKIANFLTNNIEPLKISYVIWQQKFFMDKENIYGAANVWNPMPDRGDKTQNHFDHVHVSFKNVPSDQPDDLSLNGSTLTTTPETQDPNQNTPSSIIGHSIHRVLIPGDLDRFQRWFIKVLVSNEAQVEGADNIIPLSDVHMEIKATNARDGKTMVLDVTDLLKHEHPCDWIGSQTGAEAVYPSDDPMKGYDIMNLAWYLNDEQRDVLYSPGEKIFTIRAYGTARITLRNFLKFSHIN